MESQGISLITYTLCTLENSLLRFSIGLHNFNQHEDAYNSYYPHDPEPPPPPQISSQGIIALDITQRFLSAAKSMIPCRPELD